MSDLGLYRLPTNTSDFHLRTATDADILREDVQTLFLNEHVQLYFLSMRSLKNGLN